jgi:hypothetical protein
LVSASNRPRVVRSRISPRRPRCTARVP